MSELTEQFFKKMLMWFPETQIEFKKMQERYGEVLETVVVEDLFMPEIIKLLDTEKDTKFLEDIFTYFEYVSNSNDEHLINVFSVTVLEILGNDKAILDVARKYMGPRTTQLQIEADRSLGRI